MSIESLAGTFSNRSGVNQSMGNSIMSAIVGNNIASLFIYYSCDGNEYF
jgi:hypothetical protein